MRFGYFGLKLRSCLLDHLKVEKEVKPSVTRCLFIRGRRETMFSSSNGVVPVQSESRQVKNISLE